MYAVEQLLNRLLGNALFDNAEARDFTAFILSYTLS